MLQTIINQKRLCEKIESSFLSGASKMTAIEAELVWRCKSKDQQLDDCYISALAKIAERIIE